MIAEARKQPGWKPLRSIPFLGVVRVAQLLAIVATPHRFRTKRNLWPYAGLAVVTRSSADQEFVGGTLRRSARPPRTRGLNRNHNPMLKSIFKGAATAAAAKAGPLQDLYEACVARGTKPELAKVTLARKIASDRVTPLEEWRLWDPDKLTMQTTLRSDVDDHECGRAPALDADPSRWFEGKSQPRTFAWPAVRQGTRLTTGPLG